MRQKVISDLLADSDGNIWVSNSGGVYTINAASLAINAFPKDSVLKPLSGKRVNTLFEDSDGRIWMGTQNNGVYCFDKKTHQLKVFTDKDGLISNTCYSILEDRNKNIYLATPAGFSVIKANGSIESYNQENGLRYEKCEGFLEDEHGYIWIANTKCLVRFDPVKKGIQCFDEQEGLSAAGFRPGSFVETSEGELIWGVGSGINYFYTGQLAAHRTPLQVSIYQADTRDSVIRNGMDYSIRLPYSKNSVVFHFTAIDLMGSGNIRYQYMLKGYDKDWQQGTDIRQARYASLPPGNYTFLLRAGDGESHWTISQNQISVKVVPPVWQRWWFIVMAVLLVSAIVYSFIANRNKKIKEQREEIETEQAINYFASSMSEHQTEENILWDVAKNCIGRLHFEDCVIYLMDEEKHILIQKAAPWPQKSKRI